MGLRGGCVTGVVNRGRHRQDYKRKLEGGRAERYKGCGCGP